jgi:uncharacterized protein (TIGR04141 family)
MSRPKAEHPTQRLNIFLLREDWVDFDKALAAPEETTSSASLTRTVGLAEGSGLDGRFYYQPRHPKPAAWARYVQPALADQLESVVSASSAGVLVLRASGRLFALTFGFGKALLDMTCVERRFGLKVALNRIDPLLMRSMDTKTFDEMVVTKRTQTSRSSDLPAFGVDISRDILRAVTGKPRDRGFALSLSGSDGLVLSVARPVGDLAELLEELLRAYAETTYKENFDWIDHLQVVEGGALRDSLDGALLAELRSGRALTTHMAPPEPLEWDEIDVFAAKIGGAGRMEFEELDLNDYLDALGEEVSDLSIELLKHRRVSVRFGRTGEFDDRWSVYDCLVSEQRIAGALHVLIEGEWFAVDDTLVKRVESFNAQLPSTQVALPPGRKGEPEGAYNLRAVQGDLDDLLMLDTKIVRPGGASSGVEPCDILTAAGEFIHVKRKARSSTLSHLFSQGSVSAEAILDDRVFRGKVRDAIRERAGDRDPRRWLEAVPEDIEPGAATGLTVSYVVIAESDKPGLNWLPFFSQLNLMQHARPLRNAGFTVTVTRIPVESSEPAEPSW